MPEPLSSKIGFGMNVSDLPAAHATFFRTYLNVISLSAIAQQRVEADADLALAARRHLVVVQLGRDADLVQRRRHLRAQVLVVVHRRDGEVALLGARLVAEVRALVACRCSTAPRPSRPGRTLPLGCRLEAHVVEDEELGLGPEVRGVGDARGEEVLLRLLGDVARVAAVALAGDRVGDEAVQHERLAGAERVQVRVFGSAMRTMSDSWISWNPRTDEPSNAWPSSNWPSSSTLAGIDTCCMTPGRSQNRRSTNSTPSASTSSRTSFGVRSSMVER